MGRDCEDAFCSGQDGAMDGKVRGGDARASDVAKC